MLIQHPRLAEVWEERRRLISGGRHKMEIARTLAAFSDKDLDKSTVLFREGMLAVFVGGQIWVDAVSIVYGPTVELIWTWPDRKSEGICHLTNGEVYGVDP